MNHSYQERIILVDESTAFVIKQALNQLGMLDKAKQRVIQEELNRRAINLFCQGMQAMAMNEQLMNCEQDPLHYKFVAMNKDQCVVFDVEGNSWLLLGI